ncbi:MAG: hypothetical protein ABSH03_22260 [Candidatus Lustribacter sp.]|jgi:hypothetical protein
MTPPFAFRRTLAALALAVLAASPAFAQTPPPDDNGMLPAGGHFKECHGYVRHVSDLNMRVHCIDGNPSDQSFLYLPRYTKLRSGKSMQTVDLRPDTPVHVYYTQSLGVKKAYKIYVADPNGRGLYGFRS